jgi:hypothetical protein
MKNRFDELAKDLARGISRREALRRLGGGLAGALLLSLGLPKAWANPADACIAACNEQHRNPRPSFKFHVCVRNCGQCAKCNEDEACCPSEDTDQAVVCVPGVTTCP